MIETIVTLYSSKCYTAPCYYYIYILVSFFQLEKAEEIHQQLLKAKKDLESDKEIKANSLFIDSELCLASRRWFPVVHLQPDCQLHNKCSVTHQLNMHMDCKIQFQYLYWTSIFNFDCKGSPGWISPTLWPFWVLMIRLRRIDIISFKWSYI